MTTESLRAFAARKGNAVSYWHKQKELGRLVMVDVGGKPMVDVERSEAMIASTADPAKAHMADVNEAQRAAHRPAAPQARSVPAPDMPASKNATYMQAKTAREVYEAKNAQLEYEERTGKLISVQAVKTTLATAFATTREALLQLPDRLAPVLAAETDPAAVHAQLHAELHQALRHLSGAADRIGTPEAKRND